MTNLKTIEGHESWERKAKPPRPNYVEAPDFITEDVSVRVSTKTDILAFHLRLLTLALAVLLLV